MPAIYIYIYIYIYESKYGLKSDSMNAICPFVYLFVVYFSFAPVISARIPRYVN